MSETLETVAIQFPHPGPEHKAGPYVGGVMPWNVGVHCRKFIEADGTWLDADGQTGRGPLRFWGEWEPASAVEELPDTDSEAQPTFLHRPLLLSAPEGRRQNSDPLVINGFCYSNCRQYPRRSSRKRSRMVRLEVGSVIVFGSKVAGEWVVDTVFVVAERIDYQPRDHDALRTLSATFDYAVAGPLDGSGYGDLDLVLYRGATIESPINGMYSFVPAIPAATGSFARPGIELPRLNKNLTMAVRSLGDGPIETRATWDSVRQQVLDADLLLATSLDLS